MNYDPDIERLFQELRNARLANESPEPATIPPRIVILPEAVGDVVARLDSSGGIDGEYHLAENGEIFFRYRYGEDRWYVNKNIGAFRAASAAFNRCCELNCNSIENDEAGFAKAMDKFRTELETIEPLGDPKTSLWSAMVHDTDGGLFTLY